MTRTTAPSDGHPTLAPRVWMAGAVAMVGLTFAWTVLLPLARTGWPLGGPALPRVDEAMWGLFAWAALGIVAWLTACAGLACLALLPGTVGRGATRLTEALTPALLRRGLSLLLGTGLGAVSLPVSTAAGASPVAVTGQTAVSDPSGAVSPSAAASATGVSGPTRASGASSASKGDPLPDPAFRPAGHVTGALLPSPTSPGVGHGPSPAYAASGDAAGSTAPEPRWLPSPPPRAADPQAGVLLAPTPRTAEVPDDLVTVRRGDSLWSIAARHLGPGASDREVARAWPQWYALNADVIGPDPDLIKPGQQLRIPTPGGPR